MRIRHSIDGRERDLCVAITDPDATVADLAEALEPRRLVTPLLIDERVVPAATPLDRARIPDGATVSIPVPTARSEAPAITVCSLLVTAGLDAGRRVALTAGEHTVGRQDVDTGTGTGPTIAIADPTVSAAHALLRVTADGQATIIDLGSRNGTWVDGEPARAECRLPPGVPWRLGSAEVVLIDPPARSAMPAVAAGGTRPLHRRPRPPEPAGPAPISPPPPPDPPAAVTPIGVLSVLASVGFGALMVVVLGSWAYAVFALLGPLVMVANALDARGRRRRSRRRTARSRRRALAELVRALGAQRIQEIRRRERHLIGPAEAAVRAQPAGPACWDRRLTDVDAARVRIGVGADDWHPSVHGRAEEWADDVRSMVDGHRRLDRVPIGLGLTPGTAVAIVGPGGSARCLARSIVVQAVTVHGPCDLRIAVLAPGAPARWDWTAWLPHARCPEHGSLLAGSAAAAERVATALDQGPSAPDNDLAAIATTLVVIDDPTGLQARRSAARRVLRAAGVPEHGLVPLVIVERPEDVPATCEVIIEVDASGTIHRPTVAGASPVVGVGTALDVATDIARSLATLEDPEVVDGGRGLPDAVALPDLLGPGRLDLGTVMAHWRSAGQDGAPRATLGSTAEGPLQVDLAADGPHVLVAGTTGAGKSELLRTLVTSLAITSSPDHLCFVLIDFKGGSAFDACARLPHSVGVVTDLDAALAARALRCLEAELRHREQRLRAVGADDVHEFHRLTDATDPLPRLVVVIDEFATLAAELPDFVDALVGIAQRGRSLGVHLVLATQRPSGSVSEHIKANTGLRIALRVESTEDSIDVIDGPDAASLPRRHPGRALVRFGPGDLVVAQAARVTGTSLAMQEGTPERGTALRVEPLGLDRDDETGPGSAGTVGDRDLDQIVEVLATAWTDLDGRPPRRPWPDPLPDELAWPIAVGPVPVEADVATIGLADHPDEQRCAPWRWSAADGALAVIGAAGSGTTTALATAALELARRHPPAAWHMHVIDLGTGALDVLSGLPHVGAVISADDIERQRRLVAELSVDLARRRRPGGGDADHRRLLIIDGLASLAERWDDPHGAPSWEQLCELISRGPAVGLHVCFSVTGASGPAHRIATACRQRLVMALNDPADYGLHGIAAATVPPMTPGRAIAAETSTVVQIARPADGLGSAVAQLAGAAVATSSVGSWGPGRVKVLPDDLRLADVQAQATGTPSSDRGRQGDSSLLIGLADAGLVPARLTLRSGGHALVAGPPRSGRTTTLATIALSARAQGFEVVVIGAPSGLWPPELTPRPVDDPSLTDHLARDGALLVVVDDADRTADAHPLLAELVTARRPRRHVVAAARNDRARAGYGHWLREIRADRCGIVLQPDLDLDGELVGARLPHVAPLRLVTGRGWLAGGEPEGWVQVARPGAAERASLL